MKKNIWIPAICLLLVICMVGGIFMLLGKGPDTPAGPGDGLNADLLHNKGYLVIFYTNGGQAIDPRYVAPGTQIGTLPVPYRPGDEFAGWYYDPELTRLAAAEDKVESSLSLYAGYEDQTGQVATQLNSFTSSLAVEPDFAITVLSSDTTLTAEAVKALITAKNLSDPYCGDFITVTGTDGVYQITGTDGFARGCTFRITLDDGRLCYMDQTQGVRDFNFTTAMEEVANIRLDDRLTYIPVEELKNIINNGQQVSSLNVPLLSVTADGKLSPGELSEGQFVYTGSQSIAVGDTVVVYAGLRPDLRTNETPYEEIGDIAYLNITAVNGNTYSYTNAQAEDVIIRPDLLPFDTALDRDDDDGTLTLDSFVLDFSDDIYTNIRLDSATTVDVGDYILLHTGKFGAEDATVNGYGKITAVTESDGTTVITYEECEWETVRSAMDIHSKQDVQGEHLLADVDIEALEASVVKQAEDSGFAQEVALYLVSVATATENFTYIPEDMDLTDIRITLEDGTPVDPDTIQLMAKGVKAKVEPSKLAAKVSTELQRFEGCSGVRLTLEVGVKISFFKEGDDKQIVLNVTGTFEQELRIALDVTAEAVWNAWVVFPYIEEYRMVAAVDLYDYTGIAFDVTMATKEKKPSGEWTENEKFDEFVKNLKQALKVKKILTPSGEVNVADQLADKYSAMLENETDWIDLVEQKMFGFQVNVPVALPVIFLELKADFIISVDASVSMGMDFYYMSANRYVYVLDVFAGKISSDVIKFQEETYEFTAYVVGRMGLRAGVRASFTVGVVDDGFASLGFVGEAGAYVRLYGYFYYELHYSESGGRTTDKLGAMLIEIGGYQEVTYEANMFKELLSGEISLYDKEWPLWYIGRRDDVQDFYTPQENMPKVNLKQYFRTAVLSEDIFTMRYMDMITGQRKTAVYDEEDFTITISNDAFVYDPQSNMITVNPQPGDVKLEGTMTITWNIPELSYLEEAPQRIIDLYWDNLRDGYVIVPDTRGGSYVPIITAAYEQEITAPAEPTKQGYVFAGWFSDEECTQAYTFPETMPNEDAFIYAGWKSAEDTAYTVEHYQQILGSSTYTMVESQTLTGTTDASVTPEPLTYTGFVTPSARSIVIKPDGSAVIHYYYDRITSLLTFDPGIVEGDPVTFVLQYGAAVYAPKMAAEGYEFLGYDQTVPNQMGDTSVTYTAQWKKVDASFKVEYYVQQTDGRYILQSQLAGSELLDTVIPVQDLLTQWRLSDGKTAMERFASPGAVEFECVTVDGKNLTEAGEDPVVKAGMVIKVRFRRLSYTVTFQPDNGQEPVVLTLYSGQTINAPEGLTRTGYAFTGWDSQVPQTMGTQDLSFTALWEAAHYTVSFRPNGGTGTMSDQGLLYDSATALSPNTFTREGYEFAGWSKEADGQVEYADGAQVENLAQSGTTVLYAQWKPVEYRISYKEAGEHTNPTTYTVETATIVLSDPAARTGYTFAGWVDAQGNAITRILTGTTGQLQLTARWTPHTDTPYTVKHLLEDLDGKGYTLHQQQKLQGTTDASVTPAVLSLEGFTAPKTQTVTVAADGSTVVEYRYSRNVYALSFKYNDGITADTRIAAKYGAPITLPAPAKAGYGFGGWYASESLTGSAFTAQTMPAQSMTLYAKWTANTYSYTVNHYMEELDGTWILAHTESITGAMDSKLTPAVRSYTGFTSPEAQTVTVGVNNIPVNYYYHRNSYQLTWDLAGGTATGEYTSGTVYYGAPITVPQVTRTGYTGAWDAEPVLTMPDGPLTYTMVWTANKHTVTFISHGDVVAKKIAVYYGQTIKTPTVTRDGYRFTGWDASIPETMPDEDLVFTAQWSLITYTITYDLDRGTNSSLNPATYTEESDTITLAQPTRKGHTFLGWYEQVGNSLKKVTSIAAGSTGNKKLVAKWEPYTYTVVFHSNDGAGATVEQVITYSTNVQLTKNSFLREGYTFQGWATTPNGEVEHWDEAIAFNLTAEPNGRVDLYAVWKLNRYVVFYENLGIIGSVIVNNHPENPDYFSVLDQVLVLKAPLNAPKNQHFAGWYLDETFTKPVGERYTVPSLETVTLYAKWEDNTVIIRFDDCRGEATGPDGQQKMISGTTVALKTAESMDITNPGYTFGGWATTKGGTKAYSDGQTVTFSTDQPSSVTTLYAIWNPITYIATYHLGEGGIRQDNPASFTVETADIVLQAPSVKAGYVFQGWFDGEDNKVTHIKKGTVGNVTLTARYSYADFTVTLDHQDATTIGSSAVYVRYKTGIYASGDFTGPITSIIVPAKTGYTFLGYYESVTDNYSPSVSGTNQRIDASGKILFGNTTYTGGVTLYAAWKPNTYTVTYNANGGTGSMSNTTHTYGVSSTLRSNSFTRTGWTFLGWSTSSSATSPDYTNGASVKHLAENGNVTLYAVWQLNTSYAFNLGSCTVKSKLDFPGIGFELTQALDVQALINRGYYYNVVIEYDLNVDGDHLYAICTFKIGTNSNGAGTQIFDSGEKYYDHNASARVGHTIPGRNASELSGKTYCGVFFAAEGMSWFDQINKYTASNIKITFNFYK